MVINGTFANVRDVIGQSTIPQLITCTKHDVSSVPPDFLTDSSIYASLCHAIDSLKNSEKTQSDIDDMYRIFTNEIDTEINAKLQVRTYTTKLSSGMTIRSVDTKNLGGTLT